MKNILCLGEPLGEFVESKHGQYVFGFGGDVANVAVAINRAGSKAEIITVLGCDWIGDALIDFWKNEGIGASISRDRNSSTGAYFISAGGGFQYLRAGSAASRMEPSIFDGFDWGRIGILHVSAISQAISESARRTVDFAICKAKENNITISYDTNLRLRLWDIEDARKVIMRTIEEVDIILPSLDDASTLFGSSDPAVLIKSFLDSGARTIAMTLGRDGVAVATTNRNAIFPGRHVKVMDTSGAGDCFDGYFLAGLQQIEDAFTAAEYANGAAALSVMKQGAVNSIPRKIEVDRFLSSGTTDNTCK